MIKLPSLFGPRAKLIGLLISFGLAFGAGWAVNGWRMGRNIAQERLGLAVERVNAEKAVRQRERDATLLGAFIAGRLNREQVVQGERTTLREKVIQNEIVKVPIYSQCVITTDVLRALNDAVADANRTTR